jgi:hypothetical protein
MRSKLVQVVNSCCSGITKQGVLLLLTSCILTACEAGRRPFALIEVCLRSQSEVSDFVMWFQAFSAQQGAEFTDGSTEMRSKLEGMGAKDLVEGRAGPLVSVSATAPDGRLWSASNLSLPGYQFVVSVTSFDKKSDLSPFTDELDKALAKQWRTRVLPGSVGSTGMPNCLPAK